MKTLRLVRNIAVLFLLVMALLASRPGVGAPKRTEACVGAFKSGFNCSVDFATGKCTETKCASKDTCQDNRCAKFRF